MQSEKWISAASATHLQSDRVHFASRVKIDSEKWALLTHRRVKKCTFRLT